jgi:hypothetical protein
MANYIARVELHRADNDDYEQLHTSMANKGYSRTIRSDDGKDYQLPTGTYVVSNTNVTIDTALNAAKAAANETGKSSSIIVADWTKASWNGLAIV